MNCRKIKEIISTDYIDNELPEKMRLEIELHLHTCSSCRDFKNALVAIAIKPLRSSKTENPPEILWPKIKNTLEQEKQAEVLSELPFTFRSHWLNAAFVISMLLCTALAGNYFATGILNSGPQQSTQDTLELVNNLKLSEFNDMPNEQVETVYTNIIGG